MIKKWVREWAEKRQEEKREKVKIKNWADLYEKLHGIRPVCRACADGVKCYKKYGASQKNWPHINDMENGCQKFKKIPASARTLTGVSGWPGPTGVSGVTGVSGCASQNVVPITMPPTAVFPAPTATALPPWNRGVNSCDKKCIGCKYFDDEEMVCTTV